MSSTPPSIWPFIKEVFFTGQSVTDFIGRHKLATLLSVSNLILFCLFLFATEQAIQSKNRVIEMQRVAPICPDQRTLIAKAVSACNDEMAWLQEDYRKLSQSQVHCTAKPTTPSPPVQPRYPADPIYHRRAMVDDNDLRRKLDAIRN